MPFGYVMKPIQERDLKVTLEMALYVAKVDKERKKAEEELKDTENKMSSIFRVAPTGIGMVKNRVLHEVNDQVCEITGYCRKELIGKSARILYPSQEEFKLAGVKKYEQIAELGSGAVDTRFQKKDGSIIDVLLASTPLDLADQSKGVTFTVIDITQRKKVEDALRESEEKYKKAFETSPDAVNINRLDGFYVNINEGFTKLTGYTQDEVIGKLSSDIQIWAIPEDRETLVNELQKNGYVENLESKFRCKDGSHKAALISARLTKIDNEPHILSISKDITKQKQIEKALKEHEERYKITFETNPDSISIICMDGVYVDVNPEFTNLTGFSREEVVGRYVTDINTWAIPEDRTRLVSELKRIGHVENMETKFRCKDGTHVIALMSASIIHLNNEPHILLFSKNITARIQTEKELRLAKYSIDNSSSPTIWIKQNGFLHYANKAASLLTGYSHQEILNFCFWDLDLSFSSDTFNKSWQKLEKKGTYTFESVCIHKNGLKIPVEITTNLHDFEGEKYIFAYVLDIAERRKSEMERTRLVSAIEQSSDNVIITDLKGNIEYVNPAFERNTGYSRTEVHGRNPRLLKSNIQNDDFYRDLWKTITNGEIWTGSIINKRKDEKLIEEFATIFPVLASSGEIKNFVAVKRDMTEQNKLESQLRQMQKLDAIGNLASGIAHDFNNILGAIFGYTQLSKRKLADSHDHQNVKEYLDKIFSASSRAKELIDQILMFSRKGDIDLKKINLQPLVKESVKFLRATIPTTISIKHRIDPDLKIIYGDATQIHQVIMNLCTNASHAMEKTGGALEIVLTNFRIKLKAIDTGNLDPGDYLHLAVSDTGKGMSYETKQRIFEPFFTTKEKGKGTGLGLSAVHGIVSKHGGAINVDSQEGLGTKFNIYLPAWLNDTEEIEKEIELELPTGTESILFIDDEPELCAIYEEMFKLQGFQVQTTLNSRDALNRFIKNPGTFDLVVTDYTMPEMNGIELSREIQKYDNVPVILISGLGELIPDEELKSTGIVARYSKPIEFATLIRGVRDVLDKIL